MTPATILVGSVTLSLTFQTGHALRPGGEGEVAAAPDAAEALQAAEDVRADADADADAGAVGVGVGVRRGRLLQPTAGGHVLVRAAVNKRTWEEGGGGKSESVTSPFSNKKKALACQH